MYSSRIESPARRVFDVWVKISSSSASAFDLDRETTQKYVPNAMVVLDALATFFWKISDGIWKYGSHSRRRLATRAVR